MRIIGGRWRGSRLPVPDLAGLRPTGDRLRETLFNWLAPTIHGCRCLDLYAGTGALGLEALSRGAARCVFIETSRAAAAALRDHLKRLGATDEGEVFEAEALNWLGTASADDAEQAGVVAFDLAFLDPPFDAGLHQTSLDALADGAWLADGARVYVEADRGTELHWPVGWSELRATETGDVRAWLLRVATPMSAAAEEPEAGQDGTS